MPKNTIRIALFTHSLDRGGSPISLWNLARKLNASYFCVIVSEKDGPMRERFEKEGILVRIQPRAGVLNFILLWRLLLFLLMERIQLVHLNTFTSYYKYAALAARVCQIPVVWFIREDVRAKRCQKLLPWIKILASRIVSVSIEISKNLYPKCLPDKLKVIYNGIELTPAGSASNSFRSQLRIPENEMLVGCVAAIEPRKGIGDLLAAVALLNSQGLRFHIVCLGKDRSFGEVYKKALEDQALHAGMQDRFHLLGDHPNPIAIYPEFDVFVLPAHWEGCARTLLEAMLNSCPIITTNGGGNPEVILHGKTGLITPVGDSVKMAEALKKLYFDRELALNLGKAARAELELRFSLDSHVEKVCQIYNSALNGKCVV